MEHYSKHIEKKRLNKRPKCPTCRKQFKNLGNLNLHIRSIHEGRRFVCDQCDKQFNRKASMSRHIALRHDSWRHVRRVKLSDEYLNAIKIQNQNEGKMKREQKRLTKFNSVTVHRLRPERKEFIPKCVNTHLPVQDNHNGVKSYLWDTLLNRHNKRIHQIHNGTPHCTCDNSDDPDIVSSSNNSEDIKQEYSSEFGHSEKDHIKDRIPPEVCHELCETDYEVDVDEPALELDNKVDAIDSNKSIITTNKQTSTRAIAEARILELQKKDQIGKVMVKPNIEPQETTWIYFIGCEFCDFRVSGHSMNSEAWNKLVEMEFQRHMDLNHSSVVVQLERMSESYI